VCSVSDRSSPPPAVAFVLSRSLRGGTESQAALLVRSVTARQVPVDVFILRGSRGAADFGSARVYELDPISEPGSGALDALRWVRSGVRLGRRLRRNRYSAVHAVLARAHVIAPLVAPRRRMRVVAWRRNLGDHSRAGSVNARIEAMAARRCDVVIANSAAVAAYWQRRGCAPREGIQVVPNALDAWRFEPAAPARYDDAPLLAVSVGNLRAAKGHADLVRALAQVRAEGLDVGLVVLGGQLPREPEVGKELTELAARLAVPLRLPGAVPDTRPWLAACDVYVHPSWSEGASNALSEAMAQGCRVVATEVGDARECLGHSGILVPPREPDQLASAITKVLSTGAGRDATARERAARLLSVEHLVDAHLRAYQGA